jgi:hypothetical protein
MTLFPLFVCIIGLDTTFFPDEEDDDVGDDSISDKYNSNNIINTKSSTIKNASSSSSSTSYKADAVNNKINGYKNKEQLALEASFISSLTLQFDHIQFWTDLDMQCVTIVQKSNINIMNSVVDVSSAAAISDMGMSEVDTMNEALPLEARLAVCELAVTNIEDYTKYIDTLMHVYNSIILSENDAKNQVNEGGSHVSIFDCSWLLNNKSPDNSTNNLYEKLKGFNDVVNYALRCSIIMSNSCFAFSASINFKYFPSNAA